MEKRVVDIREFELESCPLSCTWIIVGPPSSGKCLAKDTPVIMYDGSIKLVQDVNNHDFLMGDDGTKRTVLSTTSNKDKMFTIKQNYNRIFYSKYTVNEPHILCLKTSQSSPVKEMTVRDYLDLPDLEKKMYKTYTGPKIMEWGKRSNLASLELHPYLVGFLLGCKYKDGNMSVISKVQDTTLENIKKLGGEMVSFTRGYYDRRMWETKYKVEPGSDRVSKILSSLGRIPPEYLYASYSSREELFRGIVTSSWGKNNLHVRFSKELAEDIMFLIRSLGGLAYTTHNFERNRSYNIMYSFEDSLLDFDVMFENVDTYYGFQIDGNGRFLLGDFTVTHNTTFIENMMYYNKHKYPVARAFIGTEGAYKKFCDITHPLYVSNYYDADEEKDHIVRQRMCTLENSQNYLGNYAINVIDDASDDPKEYKTKIMRGLFKLGSQHWAQLLMIGSQYAIDMPPDIRKSVSYIALFREPEPLEREKLYKNFGGLAGSYENFCKLMDDLTGDYTCMIFKKRSQSNNMEDCIFWYKTEVLPPWKFGSKEYRKWGKERYDKNYVEEVM